MMRPGHAARRIEMAQSSDDEWLPCPELVKVFSEQGNTGDLICFTREGLALLLNSLAGESDRERVSVTSESIHERTHSSLMRTIQGLRRQLDNLQRSAVRAVSTRREQDGPT